MKEEALKSLRKITHKWPYDQSKWNQSWAVSDNTNRSTRTQQTRNLWDLWVTGVTSSWFLCDDETEIGMLAWITTFLRGRAALQSASTAAVGDFLLPPVVTQFPTLSSQASCSSLPASHIRGTFGDDFMQLSESSKLRVCFGDRIDWHGEVICPLGLSATPRSSIDRPVVALPLLNWRPHEPVSGLSKHWPGFPDRTSEANPTWCGSVVPAFVDFSLWVTTGAGKQKPITFMLLTLLAWSAGAAFVLGVDCTQIS